MNKKYYNAIEAKSVIDNLETLFSEYKEHSGNTVTKLEKYRDNDTYLGDAATESKEYVNAVEIDFITSQTAMHQMLINMYKHSAESFAEKVDDSSSAIIDLRHLEEVESDFRDIYFELSEKSDWFYKVSEELNKEYGHVCSFTKPRTNLAITSLVALCGGDDERGLLFDLKQKFIQYDEEESAYIDSLRLKESINNQSQRLVAADNVLSSIDVIQPSISLSRLNCINNSNPEVTNAFLLSTPESTVAVLTNVNVTKELEPLYQSISSYMQALGYAAEEINKVWLIIAAALAAGDGALPIGDIIAIVVVVAVALVIIGLAIHYMIELETGEEKQPDDLSVNEDETENETDETNERQTVTTNQGREIDVTPSDNHSVTTENKIEAEPDSSVDIVDENGNIITRRWYDHDGKASRDVDMTDHRNPKTHPEVPHEHTWDWSSGESIRN